MARWKTFISKSCFLEKCFFSKNVLFKIARITQKMRIIRGKLNQNAIFCVQHFFQNLFYKIYFFIKIVSFRKFFFFKILHFKIARNTQKTSILRGK